MGKSVKINQAMQMEKNQAATHDCKLNMTITIEKLDKSKKAKNNG